jgi:hypothetical protein
MRVIKCNLPFFSNWIYSLNLYPLSHFDRLIVMVRAVMVCGDNQEIGEHGC